MTLSNNVQIRTALNQMLAANGLSKALTDDEWVLLDDFGLLQPIRERHPDGLNQAADAIRKIRRTYGESRRASSQATGTKGNSPAGPVSRDVTMEWHADAISRIMAVRAERVIGPKRGVQTFRRDVLNDHLLQIEDVEDWIQAKAHEDATSTKPPTKGSGARDTKAKVQLLAYAKPEDEWSSYVETRPGGVLDRLRVISEYLGQVSNWVPAQATLFVIVEDFVPWVDPLRANVRDDLKYPCLSRMTLTIDPTCTPAEVADAYRYVRRQAYGRLRRLSAKHAALAAFRAEQPNERTDREQLDVWNAEVAQQRKRTWQYQQLKRFVRDADTALKRLIHLGSRGGGRSHGQAGTE